MNCRVGQGIAHNAKAEHDPCQIRNHFSLICRCSNKHKHHNFGQSSKNPQTHLAKYHYDHPKACNHFTETRPQHGVFHVLSISMSMSPENLNSIYRDTVVKLSHPLPVFPVNQRSLTASRSSIKPTSCSLRTHFFWLFAGWGRGRCLNRESKTGR